MVHCVEQSCKRLRFSDQRLIQLTEMSSDVSVNAVLAGTRYKVYIHKDGSGNADGVHMRQDGKAAPKNWWTHEKKKEVAL